eukprot:1169681-Lingulodinium_polyedra.AAC.1
MRQLRRRGPRKQAQLRVEEHGHNPWHAAHSAQCGAEFAHAPPGMEGVLHPAEAGAQVVPRRDPSAA